MKGRKMKRQYKEGEVIEIAWEDASTRSGWRSRESLKEASIARCKSVGFFCKQTKDDVTISLGIDIDDDTRLDTFTVPKSCIKKIRRLK